MAAVLRLAGIGDAAPVALGAVFSTLTVKARSYDTSGALAGHGFVLPSSALVCPVWPEDRLRGGMHYLAKRMIRASRR